MLLDWNQDGQDTAGPRLAKEGIALLLTGRATENQRRRVILNTDACNEIDDQMAIVHALLSPELKVEGIVAAHYGAKRHADSMERSYQEILRLLNLLDMEGEVPVVKGAVSAMTDRQTPQKSEGADFTIERALDKDETEPLYVSYLGPITDMASAYLMEPRIANQTVTQWIGGGWWPTGGPEFNAGNDWLAADVIFQSDMPLIQYPRGTYRMMWVSAADMERYVMGRGAVGDYLTALFKEWRVTGTRARTHWVYGDSPAIGTAIDADWGFYVEAKAPRFTEELTYEHQDRGRTMEICVEVNAGRIFHDFFAKLQRFAESL